MLFWKKNKVAGVSFNDTSRMVYQTHPIKLAKNIQANSQTHQIQKYKEFKFASCPGMIDYKNFGYIIPAWDDMHFIANKAGVDMHVGGSKPSPFHAARFMDASISEGIFSPSNGVPLRPIHIGSPWTVNISNRRISAVVLPAIYHSSFLDNLYIFPGIIDYGNFHQVNLICAVKRECEFTIKAGDPLLQVFPMECGEISVSYGPASDTEIDRHKKHVSSEAQWYRKFSQKSKKMFSLTKTFKE